MYDLGHRLTDKELAKLEKLILQIDPGAFLIVSRVSDVSGRGFSKEKKYL